MHSKVPILSRALLVLLSPSDPHLKRLLLDTNNAQTRQNRITQSKIKRVPNRRSVTVPHDLLQLWSETIDEIEIVARVGNVFPYGDVAQTCAQHDLDDGAGDGGPDGGAELSEDVEAGGGDRLVGFGDVIDYKGARKFPLKRKKERKGGRLSDDNMTQKLVILTQSYHTKRDVEAPSISHNHASNGDAGDGMNLCSR